LTPALGPSIAWIDPLASAHPGAEAAHGRWGSPASLTLPLDDRGLLLADGLFETVLLEEGRAWLLPAHLERWQGSSALLGMAPPPGREQLEPLILEAVARSGIRSGALRLNWSRGSLASDPARSPSPARGIDLPAPGEAPPSHRFWLQLSPWRPCFEPVCLIVSRTERRNAHTLLSRCKGFAYAQAIQARREARSAGADDALLLSTAGGLCCGTAANLLVRRSGRWFTPPLASGCLPGVMRAQALDQALAEEASLEPEDLATGEAALLINSLGCRPVVALEGARLAAYAQPEALWRSLLEGPGSGPLG
jgi:branched-subunit amino acid aminotransferase/4-amino-4-deoxychorismate lyase